MIQTNSIKVTVMVTLQLKSTHLSKKQWTQVVQHSFLKSLVSNYYVTLQYLLPNQIIALKDWNKIEYRILKIF